MPQRSRVDQSGRAYAGSQRQIQTYINEHTDALSNQIGKALGLDERTTGTISWVSPLVTDRYREYRDGDFLRAVGLGNFEGALNEFWPQRGPCWDALARISNGCILVEAKSHLPEVYGGGCGAGEKSRPKIVSALERTKQWMRVESDVNWMGSLYQSANRYAYVCFLREICRVEAYLVNVYFVGDPHSPTSRPEWDAGLKLVERELGVKENRYAASVFLSGLP